MSKFVSDSLRDKRFQEFLRCQELQIIPRRGGSRCHGDVSVHLPWSSWVRATSTSTVFQKFSIRNGILSCCMRLNGEDNGLSVVQYHRLDSYLLISIQHSSTTSQLYHNLSKCWPLAHEICVLFRLLQCLLPPTWNPRTECVIPSSELSHPRRINLMTLLTLSHAYTCKPPHTDQHRAITQNFHPM